MCIYLIRSTLLTLNDANRSGNYSALHLAAPDFQVRNTAADLAQIFADLRRRNFDLFAVALMAPQLTAAPAIDASKMLRFTGLFPTRPQQINFDLTFQIVGGHWRLFGIAVATPEAPPLAQANQAVGAPMPAPDREKSLKLGHVRVSPNASFLDGEASHNARNVLFREVSVVVWATHLRDAHLVRDQLVRIAIDPIG